MSIWLNFKMCRKMEKYLIQGSTDYIKEGREQLGDGVGKNFEIFSFQKIFFHLFFFYVFAFLKTFEVDSQEVTKKWPGKS